MRRGLPMISIPTVLLVLLCTTPAVAVPITYRYTADVTTTMRSRTNEGLYVDDPQFWPEFTSGETYAASGTIEWDPDLLELGRHGYAPQLSTLSLRSHTFSFSGGIAFYVANDAPDTGGMPGDSILWGNSKAQVPTGPLPYAFYGQDSWFRLWDPTATALTSSDLPLSLDGFSTGDLFYYGRGTGTLPDGTNLDNSFNLRGNITSVERVPEPETWALIGVAGMLLLAARRRQLSSLKAADPPHR